MKRIRERRSSKDSKTEQVEAEEAPEHQASEEELTLKDEGEALLDEIDSLLETNAAEFVAAYVQKGGE